MCNPSPFLERPSGNRLITQWTGCTEDPDPVSTDGHELNMMKHDSKLACHMKGLPKTEELVTPTVLVARSRIRTSPRLYVA